MEISLALGYAIAIRNINGAPDGIWEVKIVS